MGENLYDVKKGNFKNTGGDQLEELKPLDTEDILAIAWKSEITAKEMYRSFKEKIDDESSKFFIKQLLEEEKVHEKKIIEKFHDFFPRKDPKDLDPKKVGFSESIDLESQNSGDILELAKDAEKKGRNFYLSLSKAVDDHSASRLLSYLAYQENEHLEKLKKKISERDP